jgi:hypothetical protein
MHARRIRRRRPRETIVDAEPEDAPEASEDEAPAEPLAPETEHDTGLLYGVHVPPADERELDADEDHDSFRGADLGESFMETLVEKATEGGPTPEHDVDVIDDSDPEAGPSPSDHRDRPKADRGSGGRGGL